MFGNFFIKVADVFLNIFDFLRISILKILNFPKGIKQKKRLIQNYLPN